MQETKSTFNLGFVFVDLGDPFYRAATHEMVKSAKRAMPGVKITQISDKKTPAHPMVDDVLSVDTEVTKDNISTFKGHFMAELAMKIDGPLILCDVDLVWNRPITEATFHRPVSLLYREHFPSMPFNAGLMFSSGTEVAKGWWKHYQNVIDDLHRYGVGWYSDQIAAAIAGLRDERVDALPMALYADAPVDMPEVKSTAYTTHCKGERKSWMMDYARKVAA